MLIVTHEIAFAREGPNRIVFLDGGHIEASGTPTEMFAKVANERFSRFVSRSH